MVALTGLTFHDLRGVRYQQSVDTLKLMEPLTVYNEEVTGPEHAILIANRACRAALGYRGVAHLAIGKDVQMMKLSADKRSMRNPGARSSSSWSPPLSMPARDQLEAAAAVLNAGSRIAVLAGQGALLREMRSRNSPTRSVRPSRKLCLARRCCPMTAHLQRAESATSVPHRPLGRCRTATPC